MRKAFFPGSFNPFTIGHQSIVNRGLTLFDSIVIAAGISIDKAASADIQSRLEPIRRLYAGNPHVEVISYSGLTVDAARNAGCNFLLRGVRSLRDFEYEREMADVNLKLSGLETVILLTRPELATVSSSLVRELAHFGRDVAEFIPQPTKP